MVTGIRSTFHAPVARSLSRLRLPAALVEYVERGMWNLERAFELTLHCLLNTIARSIQELIIKRASLNLHEGESLGRARAVP